MGKKPRRYQSQPAGFWRQEVGGAPYWFLAAAAVTLVAFGVYVAMNAPSQSVASSDRKPQPEISTPAPEPVVRTQPAEVLSRLEDTSRPFVVSVLGDSTGAIGQSWVYQLASWMSDTYGRPVEFHQWAVELTPNQYQPVQYIGEGDGAPIVIWNGSASGRPVSYAMETWDGLLPVDAATVDLAFVNHGHNQAPGTLTRDASGLLSKMQASMVNAAIVVIGQNPQTEVGPMANAQADNVRSWMARAAGAGYATVDVLTIFEEYGDYALLLDAEGVHPTVEGSRFWADAVIATLTAPGE